MTKHSAALRLCIAGMVACVVAACGGTPNQQAAERDVEHLLAAVHPPAGAVRDESRSGTGPGGDHLMYAALASAWAYREWKVTGSISGLLASVKLHLPRGFTASGAESETAPGSVSHTLNFTRRAIPGVLVTRELEVSATRDKKGTFLSAEAQSQWLVTRSASEHVPDSVSVITIRDRGYNGKLLFSRSIRDSSTVRGIVEVINRLGVVQPVVSAGCVPRAASEVTMVFTTSSRKTIARVQASTNIGPCAGVQLTLNGHPENSLSGNAIGPIQRLLGLRMPVCTPGGAVETAAHRMKVIRPSCPALTH